MDHNRYGQPTFTTGNNPSLHFHSTIPSLVSDVPFVMHNVLNPNPTLLPHNFHDTTTASSPPPPTTYSPQTGWNGCFTGGINLNQGTNNYAQSTTTIRWPRQETLTLLEIRSRLDHCFKEATSSNHKAPLWDEISRIMNDEYGYQRSGRKCKEKFENLYKYYKKTKEGKVGKNDGKHYRFFRQLDALFGDHQNTNTNVVVDPSSQSNNSSEYGNPSNEKSQSCDYKFQKKDLIATIEESIELHLSKLMVKQEEWSKKIMCTIEHKEKERMVLEEECRKQEWARLDQEYEAWASHVARIKSRDKSLLESLQTLIRVRSIGPSCYRNVNSKENVCLSDQDKCKGWNEHEISSLIHIRASKECKFQDVDQEHETQIWEEVGFELSLLGYNRSVDDCKATWDKICVDFNTTKLNCESSSKDASSKTSKGNAMNVDGERSWGTM
ncbi:trihelix transcription factor PTL-like [Rutidosis leptorrhynchoides]|uniref:trihelix transcription factor PTL-like n=1 Tax=Rutidosis leptorrhynchoides TaxID=125765 RepID=UPI003A99F5E3